MGCEQCKLLDAKKRESDENVIANVSADCANPCESATIKEGPSANNILLASPVNQSSHIANQARESSTSPMEETDSNLVTNDEGRNVASLSLVEIADMDSNILNSTEQLEIRDEISDLAAATSACSVENDGSFVMNEDSELVTSQSVEQLPDNRLQGEESVSSEDTSSEGPKRKRRGTVRVNSVRGHKVARKLSINPGDTVISAAHRDFVQLGGHQGHFHIAGPGSLWKQQSKDGEVEAKVLKELNESSLHAYVPDYLGSKEHDGKKWIGMEDVMCHFSDGCGMDIKMGTRTFKESEVKNQKLREDLYEKMVKQDPSEPTEQENVSRAITKLRYMTFRERESSSQTLGFRIEAMKLWGQETTKDFKTLKYRDQVKNALLKYFNPLSKSGVEGFYRELVNLNQLLEESTYFKEHEFIGTSLLFIYDRERVGIWLIDFGKTTDIRDMIDGGQITHEKPWELGNYEDGYFTGIRTLISILEEIYRERADDDETVHQHTTLRVN